MNQSSVPTVTQATSNTTSTAKAASNFKGDVSELAFWNLFQQLQTSGTKQQALQGNVSVTVAPSIEPEADAPLSQQASPSSVAVTDDTQANKAATTTAQQTDKALKLDGPITAEDERFLEWLIHSANEPPTILPNGLPIPAWVANSTFNQQRQSTFSGMASQLSEDMVALVKQAYKTGRSIRVPLQNKTELILKIHQDKVSAEFIASNASMANTLQQTVADLKRHLANKQHLPIGDIAYRDDEPQKQQQQQNQQDNDDNA